MISDKQKEYMRRYYQEHKDELREKKKQKRLENPEEWRGKQKEHYRKNKDSYYKSQKKWIAKNKKKFADLCHESRRRRVERLRAEGVTNAWCVVTRGDNPKYKEIV